MIDRENFDYIKNIVRIITQCGIVDVTDDHSLLLENGNEISPKEIKIGDRLMYKNRSLKVNECKLEKFQK